MSGIIGRKLRDDPDLRRGRRRRARHRHRGRVPARSCRSGARPRTATPPCSSASARGEKDRRASKAEKGHALKAGLEVRAGRAQGVLASTRTPPRSGRHDHRGRLRAGRAGVKVTGVTKGLLVRRRDESATASPAAPRVARRHPHPPRPRLHRRGHQPVAGDQGEAHARGDMGDEHQTERGLLVVKVDPERNLLYVRGAVPGLQERRRHRSEAVRSEPQC